jgi:hypothetical protein
VSLTTVAITHVREAMANINYIASVEGISNGERAARLAELRTRLDRDIADMGGQGSPRDSLLGRRRHPHPRLQAQKGL